ncbi:MAG: exodeoxyribonuclease VII small subunit [Firmicutes bacterium]|nr:exodeoxyribonuclease VII small subunit [Bacillota bacterium]
MEQKETNKEVTFEQNLARLEEIIGTMEKGDVPLQESLALFEEGVQIVRRCSALLEGAEERINMLLSKDEDGQPVIVPFEHSG